MGYTKKPTGLSIARDSMKFTLSWKIADENYTDGQQLQYRTNLDADGVWTSVSISASVSSRTISLSASDYYPTTTSKLKRIAFRVRGKRTADDDVSYTWSEWSNKIYYLNEPRKPSISSSLEDSNECTFMWNVENSTDDTRPAVNIEYQTMLIHNCNETNGAELRWNSTQPEWAWVTASLASSETFTEDATTLAAGSYTRWIRVRSRGPAGASDWRYYKHVYARPYTARIKDVGSVATDTVTTVRVEWASARDAAHPIDQSIVQYVIDIPTAGMTAPTDGWEPIGTVADTAGTDSLRVQIPDVVDTDEALWVRVVNIHDVDFTDNYIYSDPKLVRVGRLLAPTIDDVTLDSSAYTATIAATNNSQVPDANIAIIYRVSGTETIVGVIPSGSTSATVQCPSWSDSTLIGFSLYAFQGSYDYETRSSDGVSVYSIDANMTSIRVGNNLTIPQAPETVTVTADSTLISAVIKWTWSWSDADCAELSWSNNKHSWKSTEEPNTYVVTTTDVRTWRIMGLEAGEEYYFRVRLGQTEDDDVTWGPYSEIITCGMYATPETPVLELSAANVLQDGTFTASWTYSSLDESKQAESEICAIPSSSTVSESDYYQYVVARTKTAQAVNITAEDWTEGEDYLLYLRVTSKAGLASDWSDPVPIHVPAPLTCSIDSTSFETLTISDSSGTSRSVLSLTAMPISVTISGAPDGGHTTLIIERDGEYKMDRPDGGTLDGYDGEPIVVYKQMGSDAIEITKDDLIGRLDDGAIYILTAAVSADNYLSDSEQLRFEVHWDDQAIMPSESTCEELDYNAMSITPTASSVATGATCDIYRLSADKPELIVEGGSFGSVYVDPYPTIGEKGGYRVVYKTADGDYITSDEQPAWTDTAAGIDEYSIIIDFDGRQAILPYDVSLASRWTKDFQLTTYLGGSQQGDWNPSATRTATYNVDLLADDEEVDIMRELAAYSGICHIRTPEGSSFACNIDVTEQKAHADWDLVSYTLAVTRVDPESLDGILYSEWVTS